MSRRKIAENVKRKLYAESMGKCMNPNCQVELFKESGDIIENAHIIAYCETEDNAFENLIVLCPNCHTDYDKNHAFTSDELMEWKRIRKEELEKFFSKKFGTFEDLRKEVVPILLENKSIFENYYLNDEKELWDKFEYRILSNNKKLKKLLETNLNLFQKHGELEFSNLAYIQKFLTHIDEFEETRLDDEKKRRVLFPEIVNSIFGIEPVQRSFIPSVASLEVLIQKLFFQGKFESIVMGCDNPYIEINENDKIVRIYLNDTPRLRQLYFDYKCFRSSTVRFDSLNFVLKYLNAHNVAYDFYDYDNLRKIVVNDTIITFVYEYCLSEAFLLQLLPERDSIIVNLHNWNGEGCISFKAREFSKKIGVRLFTLKDFCEYVKKNK